MSASAATYTASFSASGTSGGPTILSVTTADGGAAIAENTFIVIKGTNLVPATTAANGVIWNTAPSFASGLMPHATRRGQRYGQQQAGVRVFLLQRGDGFGVLAGPT